MIWRRTRRRDVDPAGGDRDGADAAGADAAGADAAGTDRGGDDADLVTAEEDQPRDLVTAKEDQPRDLVTAEEDQPRDLVTADGDRRALIDLVIYAYDRSPSTGIRARLVEGLARVGVTAVVPDGEPFDVSQHEAGGTEPTDDPERHDTIAATERPGFVDGDRVIRVPIVVVYRR